MKSLVWFALVLSVGCVAIPQPGETRTRSAGSPVSECRPEFPDQDGWLGADAAYSVPLEPGKSLWLFGDTFVASPRGKSRKHAKFVRNSIGVSTCDPAGGWQIEYYWSNQDGGDPRAFFESETDGYWYWPLDGFAHDGSVYVALSVMRDKPEEELFSFESIAVHLVKISNLSEEPSVWELENRVLAEGSTLAPGSTIVVDEDYVYLFTLYDGPLVQDRHMILVRLSIHELDSRSAHLEYLAKDRTWKSGVDALDALVIIETGHSEMSVRHHDGVGRWLAVSGGGFLSDRIMLRTAATLTGPWSEWKPVFRFPEMSPADPRYDEDTWCYAVKEHAEFNNAGKILVTYVCNSVDLEKQVSTTGIYRPQTVLIDPGEPTTVGQQPETR